MDTAAALTLREQIVQEALRWEDTPWHHRACLKGIGVDCVRLLEAIAKHVGLLALDWEPPFYSQEFMLHKNEECFLGVLAEQGCPEVPFDARQPGDILVAKFGRVCAHAALLVAVEPDYIIHAARNVGWVVHQRLPEELAARLRHVYQFPGLTP